MKWIAGGSPFVELQKGLRKYDYKLHDDTVGGIFPDLLFYRLVL